MFHNTVFGKKIPFKYFNILILLVIFKIIKNLEPSSSERCYKLKLEIDLTQFVNNLPRDLTLFTTSSRISIL